MSKGNMTRLIVVGLMLCAVTVYAAGLNSGPKMVNHGFDFGAPWEGEGIEVLNYQYGNSKITRPPDYQLKEGHIGQGASIHGRMPVGDFLYVKWRVLSTGKEYEDRVDLKSRLPSDMDEKIV